VKATLYLLVTRRPYGPGLLAVAVVALVVHAMADPVRGIRISVPIFISPLVAAVIAMLLARREPPSIAYVAGSTEALDPSEVQQGRPDQRAQAPTTRSLPTGLDPVERG
jgi:uncharacterized membrane protein